MNNPTAQDIQAVGGIQFVLFHFVDGVGRKVDESIRYDLPNELSSARRTQLMHDRIGWRCDIISPLRKSQICATRLVEDYAFGKAPLLLTSVFPLVAGEEKRRRDLLSRRLAQITSTFEPTRNPSIRGCDFGR